MSSFSRGENGFLGGQRPATPEVRFPRPFADPAQNGAVMPDRRCIDCGAEISPHRGPGRPRKRCTTCAPPRPRSSPVHAPPAGDSVRGVRGAA